MGAAEARAVWQRTANRCFVQEDAKRAPKLACASSSSSLSKQVDTRAASNGDGDGDGDGDGVDEFSSANSMYSNLSPDSRWWLQLQQPNYYMMMYQKGLTNQHVEAGNSHQFVDINMDCASRLKKGSYNNNVGGEEEESSYEFLEMDCSIKQVDEFSLESEIPHWMESSEKSQEPPWWQMTDKDDLASFVAQRSHDFMENCDLPQPQNRNFKRGGGGSGSFSFSFLDNQRSRDFFEISKPQKHQCQTIHADSGPVRESGEDRRSTGTGMDESKRKLLEALCHSQTRAREAEKAAKQAHEEKEDVVKLIFKQASQLFAYKQWVYLLQLENLYNQIKSSSSRPAASPWQAARRSKKARRNWPPAKRKTQTPGGYKHHANNNHSIGVAFALGLGLVGAGLLLGWTVAWMFI